MGRTQAGQLPPGLGLVGNDLENMRRYSCAASARSPPWRRARQPEPGLELPGSWPSTLRHSFIAW